MDHVALLRAINVGGRNAVSMLVLKQLFAGFGFPDVRTVAQSGNVVFTGDGRATAVLEDLLEKETERRLEFRPDYFLRTAREWRAIVAGNPFPREAHDDPGHLVAMCMKAAPKAKDVAALQAAIRGPEVVRARGKQLYVVYPAGIGTSKLTNAVIETKLGTRGTARNWNTVLKLAELLEA